MLRSALTTCGGSVATMTGLTFLLLGAAAGGAVDFSNATKSRIDLQDAADSSVLAAAAHPGLSDDERKAAAAEFFLETPFCKKFKCPAPNMSIQDGAVVLESTLPVETAILRIAGWDEIEIGVEAQATPASGTPVDVAMILDYSGSMNSSNKFQDMADAASEFLDKVNGRPGDYMQVGIVPFSKYVLTPMDGKYLYDVSAGTDLSGTFAVGCVLNREYPHSVSSATPTTGNEGSLWPVFSYVTGSDANNGDYSEDYKPPKEKEMTHSFGGYEYTVRYKDHEPKEEPKEPSFDTVESDDDDDETLPRVNGHGKFGITWSRETGAPTLEMMNYVSWNANYTYGGYADSEGWSTGSDGGLPPSFSAHQLSEDLSGSCTQYANNRLWARPLSTDFEGMKLAIGAMQPIGLTNIALGLDLGWHMLTPAAPFTQGSSEDDVHKVAILLTDGVQTVAAHGPGGSVSVSSANAAIAESCTAMKNDDVEIFTIAFGVSDAYTRNLLKSCATDEPHYFEPSVGGELDGVFEGIFNKIAPERVRLSG